ncbi:glycoside hydrolase family 92 protein [Bacillaceae bacterium SIJ1]|uniref:GH92 family glycosyl hydrolase n=1 Tax=Litoribacterium kuwaitense TaxID=1398745 RepID=UPI0013EA7387|nr:GH92 family glycosyl hydrolase [Litoribacterium kuwaitense]NGP46591.1 glycoside hydrolase family 92 protein [Litoribacterium kuwaitense]
MANHSFFTSFEEDELRTSPLIETDHTHCSKTSGQWLDVTIGAGPKESYTAKTNVGWTGMQALMYEGASTTGEFMRRELFALTLEVTAETELSYMIHPQVGHEYDALYLATYVAVDVQFTDGTFLSDLEARDQHRARFTANEQGKSKTLYPNQWNVKRVHLGKVALGKITERVFLTFEAQGVEGSFAGSIDDLQIAKINQDGQSQSPVEDVSILRGTNSNGTFSRGNNFPAVAVPHGFNFWTPVTDAGSTTWLYSYQEQNNENNLPELQAFAVSHEPSPWMGDRQTFQVMPADGSKHPTINRGKRALSFSHDNETAKPYVYEVTFDDGIEVKMAPTTYAAMFQFTFQGEHSDILFDNVTNEGGLSFDVEQQVVTGYSDVRSGLSAGAPRMYVYAEFDRPIQQYGHLTGEGRDDVAGYVRFQTPASSRTVTMKLATSFISVEQAKKNLSLDIAPTDSFDDIKERAKRQWDDRLRAFHIPHAAKEERVTFYSNLYRLYLYPNIAYENTGTETEPEYSYASPFTKKESIDTPSQTGAPVVKGKPYVNNGFWDTYRTSWPAYALFSPEKAAEMIDGFVQQYREGGWIARWSSPGYANLMVGTSSDVAFSDAYLKGVKAFDLDAFYQSAVKNAAVYSEDESVGRKGLATSIFKGYTSTDTPEGLSWALDGFINDFAISRLAYELAEEKNDSAYLADAIYFEQRSQRYVDLYCEEAGGFFIGKNVDGEWRQSAEDFNPDEWGGDYTETNAWNMGFHAPHDGQGLANLYGGREALAERLDQFMNRPERAKFPGHYGFVIHEMTEARDVRMGMYGHSNQPSHHILYMYNFAGQPWKTQKYVREVLSRLYIGSEIGQGYPGDEDNGEMSAWYIWSALGLYPLQVGTPSYVIGAPYFEEMSITLENGHALHVTAPNVSDINCYVQSLTVNGEQYEALTIPHETIANGATLEFEMGPAPSAWGSTTESLPSSLTAVTHDGIECIPRPWVDLLDQTEGVVKIKGENAPALWDNTSMTKVTVDNIPAFIDVSFTEQAQKVMMYTLTSAECAEEDPRSWCLEGSNDGQHWEVLDQQANVSFKWRRYTKPFLIQTPNDYTHYRLMISENGGARQTSLAQLELLGQPVKDV